MGVCPMLIGRCCAICLTWFADLDVAPRSLPRVIVPRLSLMAGRKRIGKRPTDRSPAKNRERNENRRESVDEWDDKLDWMNWNAALGAI